MNFSDCVVPVTGYHSETQQDFGNLLALPQTPTLRVLHPPAPSCPLVPTSPWPCSSALPAAAVPTAVLTLTPALLLPFIITFSLNQGSSWCRWRWGEVCRSVLSNSLKAERPQGSSNLILAQLAVLPLYTWTWGKRVIITVWSHIAPAGLCWCI